MPTFYSLPWGPGLAGTVFDPTDETFGPIMAAIQAGEFEQARDLLDRLSKEPRNDFGWLAIDTDIPGGEQRESFQNATLQNTGGGLDFSVACFVEVPADASTDQTMLANYLSAIFRRIHDTAPELSWEIQIGPAEGNE